MNQLRPRKNPLPDYARYSSLAFQMLAVILGGAFTGHWIDKKVDWGFPVFTALLTVSGVIFAIYVAIKDLIKK